MAWMELSLNTTSEALDWVRTLLAATNSTEDIRVDPYVAPCPAEKSQPVVKSPVAESAPVVQSPVVQSPAEKSPWDFSICIYLPYDARANAVANEIFERLSPLHRTGLTTELNMAIVETKPTHSARFVSQVHRIGQRFVVLTPDAIYQSERADEVLLRLQTTLAFGSGLHPATILSLRLIERHVRPQMDVLDLGSGSGIFSIAMAKLGAQVLALDNDRVAVQATQAAVGWNDLSQQVTVREGSLGQGCELGHWMGGEAIADLEGIQPSESFDLIAANILARVHIALADDFSQALRRTHASGGVLITAGFTVDYESEVTAALEKAGFALLDREQMGEWVAIAYRLCPSES
ncbi:MAG TPA: 50S ribosomal protein L11 methyltransferase [Chroococcidiopsis sp.]